jgi:hypothetical protein
MGDSTNNCEIDQINNNTTEKLLKLERIYIVFESKNNK